MLPYTRLLLSIPIVLAACAKNDKVPSYVEVPSMSLSPGAGQGSSTSKVTDAWVTLDEKLIGVWELPARIPMLAEGTHTIGVTPAIKRNGAFDDRLRYPFYTTWTGEVELRREETTAVQAICNYVAEALVWHEGFEDPFSQFTTTASSDTQLIRFTPSTHPDVLFLENGPCAGFRLDADHRFARVISDEDFESYGGPSFLEIDHRGDVTITIGVIYLAEGVERVEPYIYLPPTKLDNGSMPWNKVYIDLSLLFNSGVSARDVYVEARLPESMGYGEVYFDNIKLLRLQP